MYTNYWKIAWRNLLKGKLFSFINLTGLGLGAAIAILILSFAKDELSFDRFHQNSDRIYRAWVKEHFRGDIFFNTVTPYLLGTEIQDNFPEVESMVRYLTTNSIVRQGTDLHQETVHLAEPALLEIFDFEMIDGASKPLQQPTQVVITEEISEKYFGSSSPLNQTMTLQIGGEWKDFTVSGVVRKAPNNSSIQYDIIIPFSNTLDFFSESGRNCWTCVMVETYVMLKKGENASDFSQNVAPFIDEKVSKIYDPGKYIVGFQPLTDIHLNNENPIGIVPVNDGRYPFILSAIALLILILASINFTTLSIGRSLARAKEVGIRKVTGASRIQLMWQFWSEAVLTVVVSIVFGLLLARLFMPSFNQLADKDLTLEPNLFLLVASVGLALLVGLMAGVYPALVLSGFKPIYALQGGSRKLGYDKNLILRSLAGFQFGLSVILIISTLIMQNQMKFLQNKNLGYDQNYVVSIPINVGGVGLLENHRQGQVIYDRLRSKLISQPEIKEMCTSSHTFGSPGWSRLGYTDSNTEKFRSFNFQKIDENYLEMMGINLVEGRDFLKERGSDLKSAIINESMAAAFGLEQGAEASLPGPFREFKVVGVTEDFHFSSLHEEIKPLVMAIDGPAFLQAAPDHSYLDPPTLKISIKLGSENLQQTLNKIKTEWSAVAPEQPFNFSFVDDNIDMLYRKESRLTSILSIGTLIAIIIACMGLFGISALTIAYRLKEIGIRKVLGATTNGIVGLIATDFLKLVALAIIISSPVAYFIMSKWLQDFAYHIKIQWWIFAGAILAAVFLAFVTVSVQSLRAAMSNPINTLRNE